MTEKDRQDIIHNLCQCGIIQNENSALSWFNKGRLSFRVPRTNNLPSNINDVFVTLIFDIKCGEDQFEDEVKKEIEVKAPKNVNFEIQSYSQFEFSIQFSGKDDKGIEYLSGWHLDYEPKTKYPFLKEPKIYHPLFHLHYGGSSVRDVYRELNMHQDFLDDDSCTNDLIDDIKALFADDETKKKIDEIFLNHVTKSSVFITNAVTQNKKSYVPLYMIAPRIPFPPMDEFLGLDFIISNFYEKPTYDKFRKNHFFNRKISKSQSNLWKNYYEIISGYWNGKDSYIKPNVLIPSLK